MTAPGLGLDTRRLAAAYRSRDLSPVEVVTAAFARIDETQPLIHAWVSVDPERAVADAQRAERELRAGIDRGPLHGVPLGIKDIFDVTGFPTRCGSAARDDAPPATRNAPSVQALIDCGAVVLGKTVTQEFAAGVVSAPARNPWDPDRVPGGSSGGSAAAVAAGTCFGAMGSDTGGSIRIPAAACGATGFKPAFGTLSTDGVYPLSWALDTVGPIARTVDDTWFMWRALWSDAAAGSQPEWKLPPSSHSEVRLGVSPSYFSDGLHPEVEDVFAQAIDRLRTSGVAIVDADWPDAAAARACAFVINRVETAAVHERVAVNEPERFARYGAELRLRIAAGRSIPALLYLDALRARSALRDSMARLFAEHRLDALMTPTLPTTAVRADRLLIEGTGRDEGIGLAWTRLTMPFNATGQPVLALPCGRDRSGLPVGAQLAGRPGEESRLFGIGRLVESVLEFDCSPPLRSFTETSR